MIDALTVLGVAVVLPLALGGSRAAWVAASIGVTVALLLPTGAVAALFVVPWLAVAVALAGRRLSTVGPSLASAAGTVAAAYAVVAAASLLASRAGLTVFGVGEPIVQLTAVHYTYAGSAALVLATYALGRTTAGLRTVATAAVLLTATAPPVVALGFITRGAVLQVGGAVLMALGVCATGALNLQAAASARTDARTARLLLAVSGLAIWVPMALAVAWAAGQHWDIPVLSIEDMARTHGVANALGFAIAGLVGRKLERRQRETVEA
ncbi:MAG: YndJ family transporter [Acidimicrobiales bacterium]